MHVGKRSQGLRGLVITSLLQPCSESTTVGICMRSWHLFEQQSLQLQLTCISAEAILPWRALHHEMIDKQSVQQLTWPADLCIGPYPALLQFTSAAAELPVLPGTASCTRVTGSRRLQAFRLWLTRLTQRLYLQGGWRWHAPCLPDL